MPGSRPSAPWRKHSARTGSVLGHVAVFAIGAASSLQLANFTVTVLSVVCLLLVPGFLLMTHRGVDLVPLVLAALGWISFPGILPGERRQRAVAERSRAGRLRAVFHRSDGAHRARGGSDSDGSRRNRCRHGRLLPDRGNRTHPHRQFPRPLEIRHRPLGDDPRPVRADDSRGCLRLCNRWRWRCSGWPVSA